MLFNNKIKFLVRKFFSRTHFNVSKSKKVIFASGGVYLDMNYVFVSYMVNVFLRNKLISLQYFRETLFD